MIYLLIDATGAVTNRIVWDGVAEFALPEGQTAVLESVINSSESGINSPEPEDDHILPEVTDFTPPTT